MILFPHSSHFGGQCHSPSLIILQRERQKHGFYEVGRKQFWEAIFLERIQNLM